MVPNPRSVIVHRTIHCILLPSGNWWFRQISDCESTLAAVNPYLLIPYSVCPGLCCAIFGELCGLPIWYSTKVYVFMDIPLPSFHKCGEHKTKTVAVLFRIRVGGREVGTNYLHWSLGWIPTPLHPELGGIICCMTANLLTMGKPFWSVLVHRRHAKMSAYFVCSLWVTSMADLWKSWHRPSLWCWHRQRTIKSLAAKCISEFHLVLNYWKSLQS